MAAPQAALDAVAHCPWLAPEAVTAYTERLREALPAEAWAALPAPRPVAHHQEAVSPRPVLRLGSRPWPVGRLGYQTEEGLAVAELCFDYEPPEIGEAAAPVRVSAADPRDTVEHLEGETLITLERDRAAEQAAAAQLYDLAPLPHTLAALLDGSLLAAKEETRLERLYIAADEPAWQAFLTRLPALARAGWRLEEAPGFPWGIPREPESWRAEASGQEPGWFGLGLGVELDGEYIDLLPALLRALQGLPRRMREALADESAWGDEAYLPVPLADGRSVAMPLSRLRPLIATLVELFDRDPGLVDGQLLLPVADAGRLADLEAQGWPWQGSERLRQLAERLTAPLEPAPAPSGLQVALRRYQAVGVSRLQRLAADGFSGVLADDMGLGKTLQVLAHLLGEREAGRADRPSLVVAPTSVLTNWQREAARFAPELAIYVHHGPDRAASAIDRADVVVTNYALLRRDIEHLAERAYHVVALDEAQQIKNARSRVAQAARRLTARQRVCLSGTPLENHLGELWSLFHFLMPGFLGDERSFNARYRRPIERHGDTERQARLTARIRPFLLRRTKKRVAPELPEKTEMTRTVEMAGPQRDLYESVRLSVHKSVQQALAEKGVARSQIEILDALLKLRQVCCDPRLLKAGTEVTGRGGAQRAASAKLQALLELLDELLEEGRQVLVFSQFTEMLALIEGELGKRGLDWSKLTGETRDREAAVERFQSGQAPLMLVSLKAGGTGLNLTAADTVIHYDPWWNPAVEDQATDRAHRIGQEHPVFVYRLICAHTVEERIQHLQAQKGALAAGLYGDHEDLEDPLLDEAEVMALLGG